MLRWLFVTSFVLAVPALAWAQPHYCDTTAPTTGSATVGATVTLRVCEDATHDSNGTLVSLTGWALYDNGVRTTPSLTTGSTSPVSGKTGYSLSYVASGAPGAHTLEAAALNSVGEGPKGVPFVLTLTRAPALPAAPTNLSLQ